MVLTIADIPNVVSSVFSVKETARLDVEILLAYVLQVSRSYLYAWPEKIITETEYKKFLQLIKRRLQGEPIAYLIEHQEFWSLDFHVTPAVLIPRPETELLVELALKLGDSWQKKSTSTNCFIEGEKTPLCIADLGTGSGAIALSIAHEKSDWIVYAVDQSESALNIAKYNAEKLKLKNVIFSQGSWCQALPQKLFDIIISNPPYIAEHDSHLEGQGVKFEPRDALVSGVDGLDAIREIILEARMHLRPGGFLLLEHGYDQAVKVRQLLVEVGYQGVVSYSDLAGIERATFGNLLI